MIIFETRLRSEDGMYGSFRSISAWYTAVCVLLRVSSLFNEKVEMTDHTCVLASSTLLIYNLMDHQDFE